MCERCKRVNDEGEIYYDRYWNSHAEHLAEDKPKQNRFFPFGRIHWRKYTDRDRDMVATCACMGCGRNLQLTKEQVSEREDTFEIEIPGRIFFPVVCENCFKRADKRNYILYPANTGYQYVPKYRISALEIFDFIGKCKICETNQPLQQFHRCGECANLVGLSIKETGSWNTVDIKTKVTDLRLKAIEFFEE